MSAGSADAGRDVRARQPGGPGWLRGDGGAIQEAFERHARRQPGRCAVVCEGREHSYGELEARANQLARLLRGLGVGPEVVVALFLERSLEMVVAILGVLKAGGAYLPLDPEDPPRRLSLLLADARPRVCLTQEHLRERLPDLAFSCVALDRDWATAAVLEDGPLPQVAGPDHLAYVMYTSGSTGRPKGVMVQHGAVGNRLDWFCRQHATDDDEVFVQKTPYTFDVSVPEFLVPLSIGGRLVLAQPGGHRDAGYLVRLIREAGATTIHFVPSMLGAFLEQPGVEECRSLRRVLCSGEALPAALQDRFLRSLGARVGCQLLNLYGPTETAVEVTWWPCRTEAGRRGVPIGRPLPGVTAHVLDRGLRPLPPGAVGELYLGGVQLARGYLGRPDLTAERFLPGADGGRLYRTGDLAWLRPDGALEFGGRADDQVKVRGVRVEPGEVESVLLAHPDVREAAVVATAEGGDVRLTAHVAPRSVRTEDLLAFLRERLPEPMLPAATVSHDSLPRTSSGKLDRKALVRRAPEAATGEGRSPATPAEAALQAIWSEVLGRPGVGVDRGLLELGGHSLHAARIAARASRRLGRLLEVRDVFEAGTVETLAARLESAPRLAGAAPPAPGGAGRLSFSQERLWFLEQLSPGNVAYNVPVAARVRGVLDVGALRAALEAVVRRHQALRARVQSEGGLPVLRLDEPGPVPLPVESVPDAALPAALETEASRPFDLALGPLFRARLLRLAADDHVLALTMHHAVTDGWSVHVLLRELSELYSGGSPPPTLQFPVYAAWQRAQLTGDALERLTRHWRRRLAGAPVALDLPTDRARPPVQTYRGAREWLSVSPQLTGGIEAFARERGVTVFVTLLAAFRLLLGRLAGQEDVLIGTPVAGRELPEAEAAVGFFVNTLVLRTRPDGNPAFAELVARERDTVMEAFAHQRLPFEALVEALQAPRDLSRNPVVQVLFNMYSFEAPRLELPGLHCETLPEATPGSIFDLTLYVRDEAGRLRFDVVYNPDLFEATRVRELLDQYVALLAQLLAAPDRPAAAASLVTEAARRVLPDPSTPLRSKPAPPLPLRFGERATAEPGRLALADAQTRLSYGQLAAAAAGLAGRLAAAGLEPGDAVAVHGERSVWPVVAMLGVLQARGVFLVLDPAHPPARLLEALRQVRLQGWIEAGAGAVPAELEPFLAQLPPRRRLLLGPGRAEAMAPPAASSLLQPEHPAYVVFTSGSTGVPKAVLGTHAPLSHFLDWYQATLGAAAGDRFAMLGGLGHDPLLRDVFTPLWVGAELHVPAPDVHRTPSRLVGWLREREITVAHLTPLLALLLRQAAEVEDVRLPALRLVAFGGDLLQVADALAFARVAPNARLVSFYGATETPQGVGWFRLPVVDRAGGDVPLGRGIADTQLLVLAGERLAGVGELGEIAVRTPYLCQGYLNDPELTERRFVPNPWGREASDRLYRSGDLGRYRPDGDVDFAGRRDRQVKVRGFRVELGDVEAALRTHPALATAAVVARAAAGGDRELIAYLVSGQRVEASAVRAHLQALLPEHMLPVAYVPVEALPLTPNGKLDAARLPEPPRTLDPRPRTPPRAGLEMEIATVWRQVLRLPAVGVDDNFFDLGGNSLAMVEVQAHLERRLDRRLSVVDLFRYPRVGALAGFLSQDRDGDRAPALERADRRVLARLAARGRRRRIGTGSGIQLEADE